MGCLFKCLDPGPPDDSVRHFWHIRGLLIDAIAPCCSSSSSNNNDNNINENTQQQQKQSKADNLCVVQQESGVGSANNRENNKKEIDGKGLLIPKMTVQRLPPGVLYVYEGRLVYRSRRWINWSWIPNISFSSRRQPDEFSIELCQISDVTVTEHFISQRDNKEIRCQGPLVDVKVINGANLFVHFGFLTAQADLVGKELREVFLRHRQRPRIFQFNSVDIDGVEIEVP